MKQQRDQGDVEQEPHGVEGERLEPGDEQHDDPKRKRGGCSRDAEFVAPCLFVGDAERAGDHADGDEQCVDGAEQRGAEEADAPERE